MKFNKQKIFNKVAKHLLKQNARSEVESSCVYHNTDGTKCAIGCLIPKTKYNAVIEGACPMALVNGKPASWCLHEHKSIALSKLLTKVTGAKTEEDFMFLDSLQQIHDQKEPSSWKRTLKDFAKDNGLKFTL